MLVRDLKAVKSQIVNLDIMAVQPSRLRMDVTTTIGTHVATFVMNDKEVKYILPSEKRFVTGPATPETFKAVSGVELEPRLFMNVLFDQAPDDVLWTCQKDKKGYLETCLRNKDGLKITWKDREVSRKKVEIESKLFQVQLALQGFSTKVEEDPAKYDLSAPAGYKTLNVKQRVIQ